MAGYGSDEGFTAWLQDNGFTLPAGAPTEAVLRHRGSVYVDSTYGPRLNCSRPTGGYEQERAWPRAGHVTRAQRIPDSVIPIAWVNASYRAAWLEASTPGWASGSINPNRIQKRQKAGGAEREFFAPSETGGNAAGALGNVDAAIHGLVTEYLCYDGGTLGIKAIGS